MMTNQRLLQSITGSLSLIGGRVCFLFLLLGLLEFLFLFLRLVLGLGPFFFGFSGPLLRGSFLLRRVAGLCSTLEAVTFALRLFGRLARIVFFLLGLLEISLFGLHLILGLHPLLFCLCCFLLRCS